MILATFLIEFEFLRRNVLHMGLLDLILLDLVPLDLIPLDLIPLDLILELISFRPYSIRS